MGLKDSIRPWIPPALLGFLRKLRGTDNAHIRREWAVIGTAFPSEPEHGWSADSVVQAQAAKWAEFSKRIAAPNPIAASHEDPLGAPNWVVAQNTHLVFAYALARALQGRKSLRWLDWGGGLGQYHLIAKSLYPEVQFEYWGKDFAPLIAEAKRLLPNEHFVSTVDALPVEPFDLVVASGSIQYGPDLGKSLEELVQRSKDWVLVTRVPTVSQGPSVVLRQSPQRHGYDTTYHGWCFNREEFLKTAEESGLELEREFLTDLDFPLPGTELECRYRGYLFRRI